VHELNNFQAIPVLLRRHSSNIVGFQLLKSAGNVAIVHKLHFCQQHDAKFTAHEAEDLLSLIVFTGGVFHPSGTTRWVMWSWRCSSSSIAVKQWDVQL
jgi:hypothetical protein